MKKSILFLLYLLFSTSAALHAQATRTWVSGVGDDVNPCSRTAPCKTFAGAISKTAAGGEIDVLDPGGFGAVTITKSITIDGQPFLAGLLTNGTSGIIINAAPTDIVALRNISFNGLGGAGDGIRILQAATVFVEGCRIQEYGGSGISVITSSNTSVWVKDTVIRNNMTHGIVLAPSSAGVSLYGDNVSIIANQANGVDVSAASDAVLTRSMIAQNGSAGIIAETTTSRIKIESTTITLNTWGIYAGNGAAPAIYISRCLITRNSAAGILYSGGTVYGFGNNTIIDNGGSNTVTSTLAQQ